MWDLNYLLVGIGLQLGRERHQGPRNTEAGGYVQPMREMARAGRLDRIYVIVGDAGIRLGMWLKSRTRLVTTNQ
ncbi:MAG TPA: hypothetical protein VGJ87_11390 [Roseiflexaceae bacterium]